MATTSVTQTTEERLAEELQRLAECPRNTILHGHALDVLRTLPDACVQTVVTSPPYYGLRSYGTEPQVWGGDPLCSHSWQSLRYYREGGNSARSALAFSQAGPENAARIKATRWKIDDRCMRCGAWRGELGAEPTVELYVTHLVQVFREVRRVLRDDGTVFLNLGDSYAGSWGNYAPRGITNTQREQHAGGERWQRRAYSDSTTLPATAQVPGLKPKDLCMIPARVALALQSDGWWLRSEIVWSKTACMPESVRDRPTRSHEMLYLLAKSERYHYDAAAILEPLARPEELKRQTPARFGGRAKHTGYGTRIHSGNPYTGKLAGRNKRDVWTLGPEPFGEAHFAVMPTKLVEPCVLAGTSPRVCEACGAPWQRVTKRTGHVNKREAAHVPSNTTTKVDSTGWALTRVPLDEWRSGCQCPAEHNTGRDKSIVLDPFFGSGTVGAVARRHSRDYLGIELNATYIEMARKRIAAERQPHLWTA